jgi:diguanylate cyclase (GGDEF)-like protein/PAS domain S-box-containing protein
MSSLLQGTIARRRSDRVSIAFPLEVAGIDRLGKRFSERTKTTRVSRYGCCLSLTRFLQSDQAIQMRRIGTNDTAVARVVAPLGVQAEGRVYGVETRESCEGLWGIRFSSAFYENLLDSMNDGVSFLSKDRKITYWNNAAERLAGYAASEVIGNACGDSMMACVDETGKERCNSDCPVDSVMQDGNPREAELLFRHKQGYGVPISVRVLPIRNSTGNIVGAVEVFSDSTVRLKFDKRVTELEQLAFRDALTGLSNRRYMELKVEQALQDHQRVGRLCSVLMFDLDNFKKVNDTHGHEMGDALLKAIAESVSRGLRPVDIVGRWGGEEFLVLAPDIDALALGDLAERCRVLIAESSTEAGLSRVSVTGSIGATVLIHSDNANSVISRAVPEQAFGRRQNHRGIDPENLW